MNHHAAKADRAAQKVTAIGAYLNDMLGTKCRDYYILNV
jgi:hypothetical protein